MPPYMALLARAVATLEGIALLANPDYQMVSQVFLQFNASKRLMRLCRVPRSSMLCSVCLVD